MAAEPAEHRWVCQSFVFLTFKILFLLFTFFIRAGAEPADYWTWSGNAVWWQAKPKGIEEPQNQNGSGKTKSTFVTLYLANPFLCLHVYCLNGSLWRGILWLMCLDLHVRSKLLVGLFFCHKLIDSLHLREHISDQSVCGFSLVTSWPGWVLFGLSMMWNMNWRLVSINLCDRTKSGEQ